MRRFSLIVVVTLALSAVALTGCGVAHRSTAAGGMWVWENPRLVGSDLYAADAVDANVAWAVGARGTILKTSDAGGPLTRTEFSGTTVTLQDVSAATTRTVWAVGESGTILRTGNGGQTWLPQTSGTTAALYGVASLDEAKAVAVGGGGRILRTVDGRNWVSIVSPVTATLYDVDFVSSTIGWAGGAGGTLVKTSNGGAAWSVVADDLPGNVFITSLSFVSPTIGWATTWDGSAGAVYRSVDGGTHWTRVHLVAGRTLEALVTSGTAEAWAGGDAGYVWHTDGSTSTTESLGVETLRGMTGVGRPLWAVGDRGVVYGWDAGAWNVRSTSATRGDLLAYSPEASWAVGRGGTRVSRSIFSDWTSIPYGSEDLTAIRMLDGSNGWMASHDGVVTRVVAGAYSTSSVAPAVPTGLASTDATAGWMTAVQAGHGRVFKTTDGTSWTSALTTASPLNAIAVQNTVVVVAGDGGALGRKTDTGWDVRDLASGKDMRAIAPAGTNVFVAVGEAGTVMRSINAGASWTKIGVPTAYTLNAVAFSGNSGIAAGDHGTILLTGDGGLTWTSSDSGTNEDLNAVSAGTGAMRVFGDEGTILYYVAPPQLRPLAGANRYETCVEVSKATFDSGECSAVVIATGQNWPDAVSGASLAGAVHGPILLTRPDYLPSVIGAEIQRLQVDKAYILGSEKSVPKAVADAVKAKLKAGGEVYRLGGVDRYETSALIASATVDELVAAGGGWDHRCFLATGKNWPDALAASPVAANQHEPIFLVRPDGVPTSVSTMATKLGAQSAIALGDEAAVAQDVADDFDALLSGSVGRWAGPNRYATASAIASGAIAEHAFPYNRVALATGANFPDALSGGAAVGQMNGLLLLTPRDYLSPEAGTFLALHAPPGEIRFFGDENAVGARPRNETVFLFTSGY